jgi:hypothetical protein
LAQALTEHELVDEFRLMIDPVVVGGGKRLFRHDGAFRSLRLVNSQATTTGAIVASYVPTESRRSPAHPSTRRCWPRSRCPTPARPTRPTC